MELAQKGILDTPEQTQKTPRFGRRWFLKVLGLVSVLGVSSLLADTVYRTLIQRESGSNTLQMVDTLRLERAALQSMNFFDNVVDENYFIPNFDGISYWQVFLLQNPPMMCHSSTDYANQTGNSLTAIITQRLMIDASVGAESEERLKNLLLKFLGQNGDFYGFWELQSPWSSQVAAMSENGYGMLGLVTWYQENGDANVKSILDKMVESLWSIASVNDAKEQATMPNHVYTPTGWSSSTNNFDLDLGNRQGYLILPLVRYYEFSGNESALKLVKYLVNHIVAHRDDSTGQDAWVRPDGSFVLNVPGETDLSPGYSFRGHGERVMRSFAGILEYGVVVGDSDLMSWGKAVFDYFHQFSEGFLSSEVNDHNVQDMWAGTAVKTTDRGFGWYPENIARYDASDTSEASTILWSLYVAILLARSGHPEYWHVVERIARNHLVEVQLRDILWVPSGSAVPANTEQCTWENVAQRCRGGFAGWSGADVFIGSRAQAPSAASMMNDGEITGLGYYLVWNNIVTKDHAGIWVNMSISRDTKWVLINSYVPYEGKVQMEIHDAPVLFFNVADWADKTQVALSVNDKPVSQAWNGDYLRIESLKRGDIVEVSYPLRSVTRTQFVGGWYTVQWIGDTVVSVQWIGEPAGPVGSTESTSQFTLPLTHASRSSPIYGLLYQRGTFSGKAPISAKSSVSSNPRPEISFPL